MSGLCLFCGPVAEPRVCREDGSCLQNAGHSSEERLTQGVQGCKYREGAVRKEWDSFPESSGEEEFLKFWDCGMAGKGRRVHQPFSGLFCSWIGLLMRSVPFQFLHS